MGVRRREQGEPSKANRCEQEADEVSATAVNFKNQIFTINQMKTNQVHLTDCALGMKQLPSDCAQIIIADPPYNIGKDFGNNQTKMKLADYLVFSKEWIAECVRLLKPNGTFFCYGKSEILMHLGVIIEQEFGLNVKWLVWHYTNKTVPHLQFWQPSHESVLCCWKDERIFHRDAVREPYTDTFVKNAAGKTRAPTKGRFSNGDKTTVYTAHENGALPRDVLKVPALAGGAGKTERVNHPTQKPLELTRRLMKSCASADGIVVIPFAGSGTECVVAQELGLEWIAFELNPEFVELANQRLNTRSEEF